MRNVLYCDVEPDGSTVRCNHMDTVGQRPKVLWRSSLRVLPWRRIACGRVQQVTSCGDWSEGVSPTAGMRCQMPLLVWFGVLNLGPWSTDANNVIGTYSVVAWPPIALNSRRDRAYDKRKQPAGTMSTGSVIWLENFHFGYSGNYRFWNPKSNFTSLCWIWQCISSTSNSFLFYS